MLRWVCRNRGQWFLGDRGPVGVGEVYCGNDKYYDINIVYAIKLDSTVSWDRFTAFSPINYQSLSSGLLS